MKKSYTRQPPRGAKVASGSPLGKNITAHFLFNGDFRSAVKGKTGNPVVTAGPVIKSGPNGQYAQGNGSGKIVTNLLPSALGVAGSSPRTYIIDYWIGDTSVGKCAFSLGDSSGGALTQTSLMVAAGYRSVVLQMYGTDTGYEVWSDGATNGRVFLAITYDGNVTLTFRSYVHVYSATTGVYIKDVFRTQITTLPSVLKTGNTVPLNLMGGGTYNFPSMDTPLYHLSIYGGRCLSPDEIDRLYRDRHQVMQPPRGFPYATLAVLTPGGGVPRAALYMNGQGYVMQSPGGLNVKPLVLVNGQFRQRAGTEGLPVVLVNNQFRTLAPDETLLL